MAATKPNLEKSLADLENLIQSLEAGDIGLEASLSEFEKGVKLVKQCRTALEKAEQKIEILIKENGMESLAPFHNEDVS